MVRSGAAGAAWVTPLFVPIFVIITGNWVSWQYVHVDPYWEIRYAWCYSRTASWQPKTSQKNFSMLGCKISQLLHTIASCKTSDIATHGAFWLHWELPNSPWGVYDSGCFFFLSMTQLTDTKSLNRKQTLLQYITHVVETVYPNVLSFYDDLDIEEACQGNDDALPRLDPLCVLWFVLTIIHSVLLSTQSKEQTKNGAGLHGHGKRSARYCLWIEC